MGKKRRKIKILTPLGQTKDGQIVYGGVFKFYDTIGVPLSVMLASLQDRGMIPCLLSFARDAMEAGWKKQTVLSRLEEAVIDTYGRDHWAEVKTRLDVVLGPPEATKSDTAIDNNDQRELHAAAEYQGSELRADQAPSLMSDNSRDRFYNSKISPFFVSSNLIGLLRRLVMRVRKYIFG